MFIQRQLRITHIHLFLELMLNYLPKVNLFEFFLFLFTIFKHLRFYTKNQEIGSAVFSPIPSLIQSNKVLKILHSVEKYDSIIELILVTEKIFSPTRLLTVYLNFNFYRFLDDDSGKVEFRLMLVAENLYNYTFRRHQS